MANILTTLAQIDLTTILNQVSSADNADGVDLYLLEGAFLYGDLSLLGASTLTLPSTSVTYNVVLGTTSSDNVMDLPGANIPVYAPVGTANHYFTPAADNPNNSFLIIDGNGNDFIVGSLGNDVIIAGNGNDTIIGNAGSNTIIAGNGDDTIFLLGPDVPVNVTTAVYNGTSQVYNPSTAVAGNGTDFITGAQTVTYNDSGNDADNFSITAGGGKIIAGNGDGDTLIGVAATVTSTIQIVEDENDTLIYLGNTVTAGNGSHDTLVGVWGQESITQSILANVNTITQYDGNTLSVGNGSNDALYGLAEYVSQSITDAYTSHFVNNYQGNTLSVGNGNNDTLIGNMGTLLIETNVMGAGTFADNTYIDNWGNNTLIAGSGNDTLIGGIETLTITRESGSGFIITENFGDNTLIAGTGNDTMWGGVENLSVSSGVSINYGQDTFQFALNKHLGNDVIMDMNVANLANSSNPDDILVFTGVGGNTVSAVDHLIKSFMDDGSGGLLVTFKHGGSIDFADIAFSSQSHWTSIAQVTPNVHVIV